ncbi:GPI transamidase component PIG-S-like isoform X1 [Phlebotomus argentipes]|uniref:GPI transamidase component PIG-S-like isoform X1 n=1 Tax=Phlebotomus argentipes TaxID=94469 RepID=UPI00289333FE|nr:GPI transamidase component PIG-S-like isoform X1 [Phlebotomus argentipes]
MESDDGKAHKTDNTETDKYQIYASAVFIVVIIGIGVPMWWKTTEVYRVSLPYEGINELHDTPIRPVSSIFIYTKDISRANLLVGELQGYFLNTSLLTVDFKAISLSEDEVAGVKTPASLENKILQRYPVKVGEFLFAEWSQLSEKESIVVTADRTAFIAPGTTSTKIAQVLKTWIFQEFKIKSILNSRNNSKALRHKTAAPQSHYDILITIMNPRPDLQNVKWNVRYAAENYITPFLNEISVLSNFTLKTQWKYQVPFQYSSKQIHDNSTLKRHFALDEDSLPHIVTAVEKNIGHEISNNPCFQLVVYVPPCSKAPVYIYNKKRERATLNNIDAFLSPKWGGIVIANPAERVCVKYMEDQQKVDVVINSNEISLTLLYLLRKLTDIDVDIPISEATMTEITSISPRKWEVDVYMRNSAIHLIQSSIVTLSSLTSLLKDISYIVINDAVGQAVEDSYRNIVKALTALKANDLHLAVNLAKKAHEASETAFFDPSLLALLYFPDEQKYAIYIPLFLPVLIPVLMSMNAIRKSWSKRQASEAEKSKTE